MTFEEIAGLEFAKKCVNELDKIRKKNQNKKEKLLREYVNRVREKVYGDQIIRKSS